MYLVAIFSLLATDLLCCCNFYFYFFDIKVNGKKSVRTLLIERKRILIEKVFRASQ